MDHPVETQPYKLTMPHRARLATLFFIVLFASVSQAKALELQFILDSDTPLENELASLVIQELAPLLPGARINSRQLNARGSRTRLEELITTAVTDNSIDMILSTGFFGSQLLYQRKHYPKPTFLLGMIDPGILGLEQKTRTRGLHWYAIRNELDATLKRIRELFDARTVAILVSRDMNPPGMQINTVVQRIVEHNDLQVQIIPYDPSIDTASQLPAVDAIMLVPMDHDPATRQQIIEAVNARGIPSFEVAGTTLVREGALLSDTGATDTRILARRVALDIQAIFNGETARDSANWIDVQRRLTINLDTARRINHDISIHDLVQADTIGTWQQQSRLDLPAALAFAAERNTDWLFQQQQLTIDNENVRQARAALMPQVNASVSHTQRGDALPTHDTRLELGLSQSLYSASAHSALAISSLAYAASQSLLKQAELDMITQTATAYLNALKARRQLAIAGANLALHRENLSLAERRLKSGSGAGADVYTWQANIANSEAAVMAAYTSFKSSEASLAQLIDVPLHVDRDLQETELEQPPFDLLHERLVPLLESLQGIDTLRNQALERALQKSGALASAESNTGIANERLRASRHSRWAPEISLSAQVYHYVDSAETAPGVDLGGENDWSVGIRASVPVWSSGLHSSQIRQHRAGVEQAELTERSTRITLERSIRNVIHALATGWRSINLGEQETDAARRSLSITQNAYQLGSANSAQLLNAQTTYNAAQSDLNVARFDYMISLVNFQALLGDMPMLMPAQTQQQWIDKLLPQSAH